MMDEVQTGMGVLAVGSATSMQACNLMSLRSQKAWVMGFLSGPAWPAEMLESCLLLDITDQPLEVIPWHVVLPARC
jgi:hypothetical protein